MDETPASANDRDEPRRVSAHVLASMLMLGVIAAHVWISRVTMSFEAIFEGFGARDELPLLSRLFIEGHLLLVLPLISILAWAAWLGRVRGAFAVLIATVVGAGLLFPLAMVAMYQPIFALGAEVGP